MGLYLPGTGLADGSISAGDGAAWGWRSRGWAEARMCLLKMKNNNNTSSRTIKTKGQ